MFSKAVRTNGLIVMAQYGIKECLDLMIDLARSRIERTEENASSTHRFCGRGNKTAPQDRPTLLAQKIYMAITRAGQRLVIFSKKQQIHAMLPRCVHATKVPRR